MKIKYENYEKWPTLLKTKSVSSFGEVWTLGMMQYYVVVVSLCVRNYEVVHHLSSESVSPKCEGEPSKTRCQCVKGSVSKLCRRTDYISLP